jgi:ABC-type multidrug transport system fused ATPase/permease subunit
MIVQKFKDKLSVLRKTLGLIYSHYTFTAIGRDLMSLLSTGAEIYGITIFGRFIDETAKILLNWNEFDLNSYFATESFYYLLMLLLLWVVLQICIQGREYLYHVINENVRKDSKREMLAKVSGANLEDVEKEEFQDYLTFVPSYSITRITSVYDNFTTIFSNIIRFASAFVILFQIMGWTALLLFLFVIPETIAVHVRRKELKAYRDEEVGRLKFLNYVQNLGLRISNFAELRVNNIYSYLKRKYKEEYQEFVQGLLKKLFGFYMDKTSFSIVGQFMKYSYIIYVLSVAVVKRLSIGTFKALYDYVEVVYTSTFRIINALSLMSNNLEYVDEYFKLVDYEGFGDYKHGDVKLKEGTPSLEFKNLTFAYPDDPDTKVLKNLNIKIEPGEKVVFFGGDGSGKTTTVKILTGLYRVKEDQYLIDGHPIQDLDRKQLKQKLSVMFQNFIQYHFSLIENVVISGQRKNINKDLYKGVIKITGVKKFKKEINLEDKSVLGKTFPSGKELSPGYWQRLSIARTLYRNKNVFIMDEPFTFIDDMSARDILKGMFEFLGEGRSMIYITRSVNLLKNFDRIYYFDRGRIIESGSWSELMKKKGRLYMEIKDKNGEQPKA